MARWRFEPGHTEAEFRARHMMVTWVRGLFKDIHGSLEFDWGGNTRSRRLLEVLVEDRQPASPT